MKSYFLEKVCSEEAHVCILKQISARRFSVKEHHDKRAPLEEVCLACCFATGKLGDKVKKMREECANSHTYRYVCMYMFVCLCTEVILVLEICQGVPSQSKGV